LNRTTRGVLLQYIPTMADEREIDNFYPSHSCFVGERGVA
jgi:hypothetical protein